jgi:hypothetical protein
VDHLKSDQSVEERIIFDTLGGDMVSHLRELYHTAANVPYPWEFLLLGAGTSDLSHCGSQPPGMPPWPSAKKSKAS